MSNDTSTPYVGRFAPSPSGPLHFGSLVAALGSYLDAVAHEGEWLLRIEDIDPPRERPGAADKILRTLEAFGFEWTSPVLYQSSRTEAYRAAQEKLLSLGSAYACSCSRRQVAEHGLAGIEGPIYPGTCRERSIATEGRQAIRVVSEQPPITVEDRVCGPLQQHVAAEIGDFVIRRADGLYAYQLAVVLDDAYQGISHVVRGADLLLSTPRQILLQRLLGLPTPLYAHLPLVMGDDGRKLSKQSAAHPVDSRYPVPVLLEAMRFLGQSSPVQPITSLREFWCYAEESWSIDRVPRTAAK